MPLLDIAAAQPCLGNILHTYRSQTTLQNKCVNRNDKGLAFPWKSFIIPEKANNFNFGKVHIWRDRPVVKVVSTLEATRLTLTNDELSLRVDVDSGSMAVFDGVMQQSSSEDSTELNDRERLRRMRISKANKGNTPWNKGKKHSPETLQRIRERTRLAMQDPKVKMKLVNLGHAQSEETRIKIGVGVRIGWEKRREKLMLQDTCLHEWQNLIAEASRRGVLGEEELQWNSYKILDEKLKQEWGQSVEERKRKPRPKGSKRAPKSLEQRRKISEAISAKWADPSYRNRVCSGLAKYHGITEGADRTPRREPTGDGQPRKRSPSKRKVDPDDMVKPEPKNQIQQVRVKRRSMVPYKDPLASLKLEMLKDIRAQRAAAESKKTEAIVRAKLLIAEAEKAAKALEIAAKNSPLAQASIIETRTLIAEAIQSISSIGEGQEYSQNYGSISQTFPELVSPSKLEKSANIEGANQIVEKKVNGAQTSASIDCDLMRFNFENPALQDLGDASSNGDMMGFNFDTPAIRDLVNGTGDVQSSSLSKHNVVNSKENFHISRPGDFSGAPPLLDGAIKHSSCAKHLGDPELNVIRERTNSTQLNGVKFWSSKEEKSPELTTVTKKWVHGRLVEVAEGS